MAGTVLYLQIVRTLADACGRIHSLRNRLLAHLYAIADILKGSAHGDRFLAGYLDVGSTPTISTHASVKRRVHR